VKTKKQLMTIKKTKDFERELNNLGYGKPRQKNGSHMVYSAPGKPSLSMPNQRGIARGTLRNLVNLLLKNDLIEG